MGDDFDMMGEWSGLSCKSSMFLISSFPLRLPVALYFLGPGRNLNCLI